MKTGNRKSEIGNGFTLIELLVVISIIAILAGLAFPLLRTVKKTQYIKHATGEMHQLEAAIESYKSAHGFYPPSNPGNPLTNQLYYELIGTTNTVTSPQTFRTLDGEQTLKATDLTAAFGGVSGLANCSRHDADAESVPAKNFLGEIKSGQTQSLQASGWPEPVTLLVTSVNGPDREYQPIPGKQDFNPWRYVSPGVKNPNSYDLWVQIRINGETYLICNWNTRVQAGVPLP